MVHLGRVASTLDRSPNGQALTTDKPCTINVFVAGLVAKTENRRSFPMVSQVRGRQILLCHAGTCPKQQQP